jgi:hypothetical protein
MTTETYIKHYSEYDTAFEMMTQKKKACKRAGNSKDIYCVVPGPQDDYAVVDLGTAIDLGLGYVWNFSSTGYIRNPF